MAVYYCQYDIVWAAVSLCSLPAQDAKLPTAWRVPEPQARGSEVASLGVKVFACRGRPMLWMNHDEPMLSVFQPISSASVMAFLNFFWTKSSGVKRCWKHTLKRAVSSHGSVSSVHELGMVQGPVEEQIGGSRPSAWSLAPWSSTKLTGMRCAHGVHLLQMALFPSNCV